MIWALIINDKDFSIEQEIANYYGVDEDELTGGDFPVIISGTKNHAAVISTIEGSEGLEMEIADHLFAKYRKEIYLLYDSEIQFGIYLYNDGDIQKEIDRPIEKFLKSVGIELDPYWVHDTEKLEKSPVKTIAVFENTTRESIMNLLGYDYLPDGVFIESIGDGRVRFHSEHGNIIIQVIELSCEIPEPIYFIHYDRESGDFGCTVIKDGEEIGIFQYPEYTTEDLEELKDINGAKTPETILENFGVSPSLLNL